MEEVRDPLFKGLTRPTMYMGVTQIFFVLNGMVSLIAFLASGTLLVLVITFPILHGLGYMACSQDPRIFDIWSVFLRTCTRCRNRNFWKGNSYDPF